MTLFRIKELVMVVIALNLPFTVFTDRAKLDRGTAEEYCQYESFQPQCLKNEVILIKSATYGRMRTGRCITAEEVEAHRSVAGDDPRYLGCFADVLALLDRKCSGKSECEVRVIDMSLEKIKPCFPGLNVYLEVIYECISVVDEQRSCVVTASTVPIHIIGSFEAQRICGTKSQPWIVGAPVGQKIRIHLIEFRALDSGQIQEGNTKPCLKYGVIVDKENKRNISICGGGAQRENKLHLSGGNALDIVFDLPHEKNHSFDERKFLLKLEAVGCLDLIPPEDAWLKRNDDSIVIGCYSSRQTWHLHCEGEKWIGVFGNCSEAQELLEDSEVMPENWTDEQILTVVAVAGFTLTICLVILCTGIVCLRRFSAKSKMKQDYKTLAYHVNSSQRQQRDQGMSIGLTNGVTGNDVRGMNAQQAPTYSVFVGESGYNDAENQIS